MEDMLKLIRERQSVKGPYDTGRMIAKQDLRQILEAARWAPTPHNMQNYEIVLVDDKSLLESLANIRYPITDSFIQENYQYLSLSEEELLRKKIGLLGTRFPAAFRTPGVKPDEAAYEELHSGLRRLIEASPILGVVTYDPDKRAPDSEGDFLGHIGIGCVLENMWLMAHRLGIGLQVISIFNKEPAEGEVKRVLAIPESLKIAFAFRLGYALCAPAQHLRVRREVDLFTHHNRFGNRSLD
jgi:nitroreductase